MNAQTSRRMNAADVVDIAAAAIITAPLRQIVTCLPALGGGWSEELIVCVSVCLCAHRRQWGAIHSSQRAVCTWNLLYLMSLALEKLSRRISN